MTYLRDLSPCTYVAEWNDVLAVGWLSPFVPHRVGRTSKEFRRRLERLCSGEGARDEDGIVRHRGYHVCGMWLGRCHARGNAVIRVCGAKHDYAAPQMIHHYVTRHFYRPPKEFMEAVVSAPER